MSPSEFEQHDPAVGLRQSKTQPEAGVTTHGGITKRQVQRSIADLDPVAAATA